MTPEAGLIVSRFAHDASLTIIFGASLFQFYAGKAGAMRSLRTPLVFFMALALLTVASLLAFTAANMQGDIAGLTDMSVITSTLTETSFGAVWLGRAALLIVLALIVVLRRARGADSFGFAELVVAAAALASIALTGHTQMQEGAARTTHVIADALHLLGAGAWLGGIFALLLTLLAVRRGGADEIAATEALRRFSPVGYVAVATIAISGLVNTLYLISSLTALFATRYGQLLLIKLSLVGFMLLLAGINRFVLVPRLASDTSRRGALGLFTVQVTLEQLAGLGVLAVVAVLGMTEAPV